MFYRDDRKKLQQEILSMKRRREELIRKQAQDQGKGKRIKESDMCLDPSPLYEALELIDKKEEEVEQNRKNAVNICFPGKASCSVLEV